MTAMELFNENLLASFQPTSKDMKTLVPILVSLFQGFQENINFTLGEIKSDIVSQIQQKNEKITTLENEISALKQTVEKLQDKIDDNDAFERKSSVIMSGRMIPAFKENENLNDTICGLIRRELSVNLKPEEISAVHRMGGKSSSQKTDRRPIILKLCKISTKSDLILSARAKKSKELFLNEFLTPQRQTISYVLRRARREFPHLISGSTTIDGRNFVWIKNPSNAPGARDGRRCINNQSQLCDFCENVLNKPLTHFISEWKH